jgi:hypothetical protein
MNGQHYDEHDQLVECDDRWDHDPFGVVLWARCPVVPACPPHLDAAMIRGEAAARAALGVIPPIVPAASERPFTIRFGRRAREEFMSAAAVAGDGKEWGGYLLGWPIYGWKREIEVPRIRGVGPYAVRRERSLSGWDKEWRDAGEVDGLEVIGTWHTHFVSTGPSPTDLAFARDDLIEREPRQRTHFVELVVSPLGGTAPAGGDWSQPLLELFVLHR